MKEDYADFDYTPRVAIPKEFRQLDWTYVNVRDKSFSEGEEAFGQLRDALDASLSGKPFLRLHLLRAVEDRLTALAVEKRQPTAKCLEHLQKRVDLEYDRGDIYRKAATAVVFAKYLIERAEPELAHTLLEMERQQLEETASICRHWLDTIAALIQPK